MYQKILHNPQGKQESLKKKRGGRQGHHTFSGSKLAGTNFPRTQNFQSHAKEEQKRRGHTGMGRIVKTKLQRKPIPCTGVGVYVQSWGGGGAVGRFWQAKTNFPDKLLMIYILARFMRAIHTRAWTNYERPKFPED